LPAHVDPGPAVGPFEPAEAEEEQHESGARTPRSPWQKQETGSC
jgi:hypothetical protein